MKNDKEMLLDTFTKEAIILISEKMKKHDNAIADLKERIDALSKKIDTIYSTSSTKAQPIDILIIERLKNLEEKVNRLETMVNSLRIPSIDRELLEKLK